MGQYGEIRESMDSAGSLLDGRHCKRHSSDCTALPSEETVSFKESFFAWSGLSLYELP